MAKKRIKIDIEVETSKSKKAWLFDFIEWLNSRGEKCGGEIEVGTSEEVDKDIVPEEKKKLQKAINENMGIDDGWEH